MSAEGPDEANKPSLISQARKLRRSDTLAEKLAWKLLRNRRLLGFKFRRQVPVHNAIADFCCLSLKLIVELDGAGHAYETQSRRDGQRDRELVKRGYRVLRFPNGMVLKAPTEFVKKIADCIAQVEQTRFEGLDRQSCCEVSPSPKVSPSPPSPSPRWGEGSRNGDHRSGFGQTG